MPNPPALFTRLGKPGPHNFFTSHYTLHAGCAPYCRDPFSLDGALGHAGQFKVQKQSEGRPSPYAPCLIPASSSLAPVVGQILPRLKQAIPARGESAKKGISGRSKKGGIDKPEVECLKEQDRRTDAACKRGVFRAQTLRDSRHRRYHLTRRSARLFRLAPARFSFGTYFRFFFSLRADSLPLPSEYFRLFPAKCLLAGGGGALSVGPRTTP